MPSWLRNISTFFSEHCDCSTGYSCGCARFDTIVSYFNGAECCSASCDTKLARFNRVIHNEATRRESWDFCCVCSMPCTRKPIRTRILLLHISIATLRGRSSFRPLPPRTRVGGRCRRLKLCCGIKWGLGCPLQCSLLFSPAVSVRNSFSRQLGSCSRAQSNISRSH